MIRLRDLAFSYGSGFRLEVSALDLAEGEVLSIIGPNGAGKTTLLNAMATLDRPRSGKLEILGMDALDPANRLALRRAVSYVFSQPYLTGGTVRDNVELPLKLRGVRDPGAVEKMLELFRLGPLAGRDARTLSQGESHRAVLARAFVTRPRLALLDEPFSALDERVRDSVARDLREVIRSTGAAAVFVTQDQAGALALCDRLGVMMGGRLAQCGPAEEVFSRPVSPEVADFVGVETILPGRVVSLRDNLCAVELSAPAAGGKSPELMVVSDCAPGEKVFVCARPEDVSVALGPEAGGRRNNFRAKVVSAEPWKLEYKLELDCGFPLKAAVTKQLVEGLGIKAGLEVYASFKATALHLIKRAI